MKPQTEKIDEFAKGLAVARAKTITARTILDLAKVPPDEAIGSLRTGWRQIAVAIEQIKRASDTTVSLTFDNAFGPGGLIPKKLTTKSTDIEDLSRAHAKYLSGEPTHISRSRYRRFATDLETAVLALERWRRQNLTSTGTRAAHFVGRLGVALAALITAGAIAGGLTLALSKPKADDGLSGAYFLKTDFMGRSLHRLDHTINFNWGPNSPRRGVPANYFSVRWEGCIYVEADQPMFLVSGSDDGMTVFINGALMVDNGGRHVFTQKWSDKKLTPGIHSIRIDFVENVGDAHAYLGWSESKAERPETVPYTNLIPKTGNRRHKCPYGKLSMLHQQPGK